MPGQMTLTARATTVAGEVLGRTYRDGNPELNQVDLKHCVSFVDLQAATNSFVNEHDQEPRPTLWEEGPQG